MIQGILDRPIDLWHKIYPDNVPVYSLPSVWIIADRSYNYRLLVAAIYIVKSTSALFIYIYYQIFPSVSFSYSRNIPTIHRCVLVHEQWMETSNRS